MAEQGMMEQDMVSCVAALLPWGPDVLIRLTLLAVLVLLAGGLPGRRYPALRHMVSTVGMVCLLLLGLLSLRLDAGGPWWQALAGLWGTVAAVLVLRQVVHVAGLSMGMHREGHLAPAEFQQRALWLARRLGLRLEVQVRLHPEGVIPHTWGLLRPVVVLPGTAVGWAQGRLDAVLLHEMAHIRRRDILWAMVNGLGLAVYWFHPLVWWLARRVRQDSEHACDAMVVQQGISASDYARHLVAIVREARAGQCSPAPAMARQSDLEGRIGVLLAARSARSTAWRINGLAAAAMIVLLLAPTILLAGPLRPAPQTRTQNQGGLAACFTQPDIALPDASVEPEDALTEPLFSPSSDLIKSESLKEL